ncbi:MAG TPA: hypothetical protein VF628_14325 [Allosphingosinicella sp.]
MFNSFQSRRFASAILAVAATLAIQSAWLAGLDRDAASVISAGRA